MLHALSLSPAPLSTFLLWPQVRKTYSAVVLGHLEGKGVIDVTLDTRPALTEYAVVQQGSVAAEGGAALPTTLVRLNPHTGGRRCCCAVCSLVVGEPPARQHPTCMQRPVLGSHHQPTGGFIYCLFWASIQVLADQEVRLEIPLWVLSLACGRCCLSFT